MKQSKTENRRLVLAERPKGTPTESTLTLETREILSPKEGEIEVDPKVRPVGS